MCCESLTYLQWANIDDIGVALIYILYKYIFYFVNITLLLLITMAYILLTEASNSPILTIIQLKGTVHYKKDIFFFTKLLELPFEGLYENRQKLI